VTIERLARQPTFSDVWLRSHGDRSAWPYASITNPTAAQEQRMEIEITLADGTKRTVKVRTNLMPTPIIWRPRHHDWQAVEDNSDLASPIGWGTTEEEAIKSLKQKLENRARP
jgi:hypothetical protein